MRCALKLVNSLTRRDVAVTVVVAAKRGIFFQPLCWRTASLLPRSLRSRRGHIRTSAPECSAGEQEPQ